MTEYPGSGGYGDPNPPGGKPPGGGDPWATPYQGQPYGQPEPAGPDEPTAWGTYTPPQQPQPPQQQPVGPAQYGPPPISPGGPPPMYPGGNFPPPRNNRTALYVTLGVGAAVLLVIVLVVSVVAFSGGSSSKDSAGDMVTSYLEALAAGDAEAALSYSADQPASTELLTDEILQQQVDEMPITDIRILSDDANNGIGMGSVHVTAKFGDKLSDATLMVQKKDGQWKLDSATVRVDNTMTGAYEGASSTLTAFGKPVGDSVFYVFPGFIEWGSDNDYIDVPSGNPLLLDSLGVGGYVSMSAITYELSDSGKDAIKTAVDDALAVCAQSHAMEPPNCPQYLIQFDAVDGTVNWTAPSTEDAVITLNDYDMSATVDVDSDWGYSVRLRDGGTDRGTQSAFMYLTIDLTQDPLQVSLN